MCAYAREHHVLNKEKIYINVDEETNVEDGARVAKLKKVDYSMFGLVMIKYFCELVYIYSGCNFNILWLFIVWWLYFYGY